MFGVKWEALLCEQALSTRKSDVLSEFACLHAGDVENGYKHSVSKQDQWV
jgi:hypothetical protein